MLKVPAIYTLEASLCGGRAGGKHPHYNTENLMQLGRKFCLSLIVYGNTHKVSSDLDITESKVFGLKSEDFLR
jgi:hypothetical protein